jgi:hypothetical protein
MLLSPLLFKPDSIAYGMVPKKLAHAIIGSKHIHHKVAFVLHI